MAPARPATAASRPTPAIPATATARAALPAWWAPRTGRGGTSTAPQGVSRWKAGRRSSSRRTPLTRTSAPPVVPAVRTAAPVRSRLVGGRQQRERHADLVVERHGAGPDRAGGAQGGGGEVLGRRLAGAAGDADHRHGGQPLPGGGAEGGEGGGGVVDEHETDAFHGARHHRPGGAPVEGVAHEVVPVALRPQGHEQRPRRQRAGVDGIGRGDGVGVAAEDVPAGRRGDVGQGQAHAAVPGSSGPQPSRASSSRATTRSSNGTVTPPAVWPCSWPLPATTTTSPGARPVSAARMARRRSATTIGWAPDGMPATTSSMMARGSSERGLSEVTTITSASPAAAFPMAGRLARSRSPP